MSVKMNRLFGSILLAGCGASVVCTSALAASDDANGVFAPALIASVGPDVLARATGNYGINIAAGLGNRQGNVLVVPQAGSLASQSSGANSGGTGGMAAAGGTSGTGGTGGTGAASAKADGDGISITTIQSTAAGTHGAAMMPVRVALASLGAGALAGSVGNIGINIAAGYGNLQQNTLISR